jgi:hypothetical protein
MPGGGLVAWVLPTGLESGVSSPLRMKETAMLTQTQLSWLNHLFFASMVFWFLAWQESTSSWATKYGPSQVAKALYIQPRTPPPVFDPEVTDTSLDSYESNAFEPRQDPAFP